MIEKVDNKLINVEHLDKTITQLNLTDIFGTLHCQQKIIYNCHVHTEHLTKSIKQLFVQLREFK